MFAGQDFAEFSFGEQVDSPIDSEDFLAFLAAINDERCWLLEIDVFPLVASSTGSGAFCDGALGEFGFGDGATGSAAVGVTTLRYGTHGYTSQASDSPANTWYEGRLNETFQVDRRITGGEDIGGLSTVGAECALINADGALDGLLTDYAVDGRSARILVGRPTDPLANFGLVFSGVMQPPVITEATVTFKLSDGLAKLQTTILNETVYLGTGGLEGGADLKGKPKPKGWGSVQNISPPLVDSANFIYQVNDGPISGVPAVYDRGVLLTGVVGAPGAGQYQVTTSTGTFKLGATPAGTVTCDALLDASGSGYINNVSDIVLRILTQQVGLLSTEIEPASFAQLKSDAPAEVGVWHGSNQVSAADVVNELLAGIGAFGGFNRTGAFSVGLIAAPSGLQVVTLEPEEIMTIAIEPLPAAVAPIVWRASVAYKKNYTVQTDLAGSVTAARRTFAAEDVRISKSEDSAIQSRYLLAMALENNAGLYAQPADSDAEALRLFNLWGMQRGFYRITARPKALIADLGKTVFVTYPRFGFANGRLGRVLGHMVRGSEVELLALC